MKKGNLAIHFKNVSKKYLINHEKSTLIGKITSVGDKEKFLAVNKVNLTIKKGEIVGIIGDNGSGKTTLLKLIAGITKASSGQIKTEGKIISLLDIETGFHADLTGEQNIYLNGLILGMSREEIDIKKKSIIDFADIGKFINAPMYTYSAGMKVRLGFAVAIHADSDVLIFDEQLSVGDNNFHIKADRKILEQFQNGKTVVVVSHFLPFLRDTCQRILMMKNGKVIYDGGIDLLDKYENNLI